MIAFEKIVEAVEFSNDEGTAWWEEFNSVTEAKRLLKQASRYNADEWEVVHLAEALGEDYPTSLSEISKVLAKCFSKLKNQLRNKK